MRMVIVVANEVERIGNVRTTVSYSRVLLLEIVKCTSQVHILSSRETLQIKTRGDKQTSKKSKMH